MVQSPRRNATIALLALLVIFTLMFVGPGLPSAGAQQGTPTTTGEPATVTAQPSETAPLEPTMPITVEPPETGTPAPTPGPTGTGTPAPSPQPTGTVTGEPSPEPTGTVTDEPTVDPTVTGEPSPTPPPDQTQTVEPTPATPVGTATPLPPTVTSTPSVGTPTPTPAGGATAMPPPAGEEGPPLLQGVVSSITVVGEGTVRAAPDVAQATIGVEIVRPSVQEASAEVESVMAAVLQALEGAGVAREDIQTSGFSIYAERFGMEEAQAEESVRYRVSNSVSVIIRDLNRIGEVLDRAIQAGANNVFGINFRLQDPGAVESEARRRAVDHARAKAEELAQLTGASVGPVISISEVIDPGGFSGGMDEAAAVDRDAGPIAPGQLVVSVRLQIRYHLR